MCRARDVSRRECCPRVKNLSFALAAFLGDNACRKSQLKKTRTSLVVKLSAHDSAAALCLSPGRAEMLWSAWGAC